MGAVCIERRCGFKYGMNQLEFRFKKTHDPDAIVAQSRRDRCLIVRRLCVDHAVDPQENTVCRSWNRFHNEEPQSPLDRAAIAVRLDRERGVLSRTLRAGSIELQVTRWSRSHDHVDPDCEERPRQMEEDRDDDRDRDAVR